jgi:hypothetical protein
MKEQCHKLTILRKRSKPEERKHHMKLERNEREKYMCLSSNDDENNRKSEENNENIEMSA